MLIQSFLATSFTLSCTLHSHKVCTHGPKNDKQSGKVTGHEMLMGSALLSTFFSPLLHGLDVLPELVSASLCKLGSLLHISCSKIENAGSNSCRAASVLRKPGATPDDGEEKPTQILPATLPYNNRDLNTIGLANYQSRRRSTPHTRVSLPSSHGPPQKCIPRGRLMDVSCTRSKVPFNTVA